MRSNKIYNEDLFTHAANANFTKHVKTQSKRALEIIKEKVDWDALAAPLAAKIAQSKQPKSPAGRNSFSLVVILRCFILQRIYHLSDPRLEEEIADRRSFQMFLDLTSADSIPDETTICRYRELFARLGLDKELFKLYKQQLKALGLIVGKGTLVDATIKKAQATPASKRDADAQFTKKRGTSYYGYKGHIGCDADTNVIHSVEFTPANVHDSTVFDDLITGEEQAVFGDKGYANRKRKRELRARGVFCGILDKGFRNRLLSSKQKKRNKKLSSVRNAVERPFAFMKHVLNDDRCSYYDHDRNRFEFMISVIVYNMRCAVTQTA
jgi:IS5 family transposase